MHHRGWIVVALLAALLVVPLSCSKSAPDADEFADTSGGQADGASADSVDGSWPEDAAANTGADSGQHPDLPAASAVGGLTWSNLGAEDGSAFAVAGGGFSGRMACGGDYCISARWQR